MTEGSASREERPASEPLRRAPLRFGPGFAVGLFALWLPIALAVYGPALAGPFVSDDLAYVSHNPVIHALSVENVCEILDPQGEGVAQTANYAPLHLLLHAAVWKLFGAVTPGHHLVNVVLHVLVSVLVAAFFARTGIPRLAAAAGGLLFLLHPANVEAVAWIFQLKTLASTGLALGALLLFRRRPGAASILFALGLLTKITAGFALPVALALVWTDRDPPESRRSQWAWLMFWAGILLTVGGLEWQAGRRAGVGDTAFHMNIAVHVRTIFAIAMRYFVMATTTIGLSTFHEPPRAVSLLDPWWLTGLAALLLAGWRTLVTWFRRDPEAVYWIFAAASWLPVSQVIPFPYPMADRYLYAILPGLVGVGLLAGNRLVAHRVQSRGGGSRDTVQVAAVVLVLALTGLFGVRSAERARVWHSAGLFTADAALNYPDGAQAHLLRAKRAARHGDGPMAADHLRAAFERGHASFQLVLNDPAYAAVLEDPAVRTVVRDMAGWWTARAARVPDPTQAELWRFAQAHLALGEEARAREYLERALRMGGRLDSAIREELARLPAAGEESLQRPR